MSWLLDACGHEKNNPSHQHVLVLLLVMHGIVLMHYYRQFYCNQMQAKFIQPYSTRDIVQQRAAISLLIL